MAKRAQATQAATQATQATKKERIKVSAGAVSNIKEVWSDAERCLFNCTIYDNIDLYGLTARFNAEGVMWVAMPSDKGKDGKYYKRFYLEFASDALDKIEKALYGEV